MRNKLSDLNNHLFEQLERLNDEDLTGDNLQQEVVKANAMIGISDKIISIHNAHIKAVELVTKYGANSKQLPQLEGGD